MKGEKKRLIWPELKLVLEATPQQPQILVEPNLSKQKKKCVPLIKMLR